MADHPTVRLLRLTRRVKVNIAAKIGVRGELRPVAIRDISPYGALVVGASGVSANEEVVLELSGGREIRAQVRWVGQDRCGVEFVEPVPGIEPLLATSERVAETGAEALLARGDLEPGSEAAAVAFAHPCARGTSNVVGVSISGRRMLERTCRKQGFAWLAEEAFVGALAHEESGALHHAGGVAQDGAEEDMPTSPRSPLRGRPQGCPATLAEPVSGSWLAASGKA